MGTLPSEIALLPELAVWGMERGGLTGMYWIVVCF